MTEIETVTGSEWSESAAWMKLFETERWRRNLKLSMNMGLILIE
jgi:hypothetical protein